MGRKQWKIRKYLLFYSASLLVIMGITPGCIVTDKLAKDKILIEATPIDLGRNMMQKGDYIGALDVFSGILRNHPKKSPGDRALFEMGILFAYPDNPDRNRSKASGYFKRLIREFPGSPMRGEALAWIDTFKRISESDEKIRALSEENSKYKKQVKSLEQKSSEYEEKIRAYEEQINALKEIDIGIEEKKRQLPAE